MCLGIRPGPPRYATCPLETGASSKGYQPKTVWQVIAVKGELLPDQAGLKPDMTFAEPAIERFFTALAEALAEHDARGWEDNADREQRRAIDAYREMLARG